MVAARPGLRTLLRGGQSECFPHIGPEYTDDQIFRCGRNASNTMRVRDLVLVSHFRGLPCSSRHERASRCGQEHTDTDELLCLGTANDSPHFQHKDRCTGQAASHVPSAAAHFVFAEDVQLTNISVRHVGGWGVWFGAGCRDCALRHSTVTDTGAGGARVGEAGDGEPPLLSLEIIWVAFFSRCQRYRC